jgi:geranylgeranyl pyrophosphate synthase
MRTPDELRELTEDYLRELALTPELHGQAESVRYAVMVGGKRVRPVICLATAEAVGVETERAYLDITASAPDEVTLHRLKTGCLFAASVGLALWVGDVPESEQRPWRAFGDELGLLFQIVDDILDGDGYVLAHGENGARVLADEAAERAHARLEDVDADTSVLADIVSGLATRTA